VEPLSTAEPDAGDALFKKLSSVQPVVLAAPFFPAVFFGALVFGVVVFGAFLGAFGAAAGATGPATFSAGATGPTNAGDTAGFTSFAGFTVTTGAVLSAAYALLLSSALNGRARATAANEARAREPWGRTAPAVEVC
jgi:hypothetical protein